MTDSLLDNTLKLQLFLGFLATAALVWSVCFFGYFGVSIKSIKSFIKGVGEFLLATLSLTHLGLYALVQIAVWVIIAGVAVLIVVGVVFLIIKGFKFIWYF